MEPRLSLTSSSDPGLLPPFGQAPTPDFPFRILAQVGAGNMGVVFKAVEEPLQRTVAIKVLRRENWERGSSHEQEREAQLRFLQEARSAAAIRHPGAVTIYRVGEFRGWPYIVMEWLEGVTLAARLARDGPLDFNQALVVAQQVCQVLAAAHQIGVIHRDIKPANLMLLRDGTVKVSDFGIARFPTHQLVETQTGVFLGTPFYASPEQLRGEEIDARSDIYSLSVVLFEMLTGKRPFPGDTFPEYVTNLFASEPQPPSRFRANIPPALEAVVLKGLRRNRGERWASAADMATALATVAAALANVAAPPAPLEEPFPEHNFEGLSTIKVSQQASYPVLRVLHPEPAGAVASYVRSWTSQDLPRQRVEGALLRLLAKPLHAQPFSGAVEAASLLLLIHQGAIVGALVNGPGGVDSTASPSLPGFELLRIYMPPADQPASLIPFLATMLAPAGAVESTLDATLVPPEAVAAQLLERGFSGGLWLSAASGSAWVLLEAGRPVLSFALGSWEGVSVEATWTRWAKAAGANIHLLRLVPQPLPLTYALQLRNAELLCRREATGSGSLSGHSTVTRRLRNLVQRLEETCRVVIEPKRPAEVDAELVAGDPAVGLLRWLTCEAVTAANDEELRTRWKYLLEWIPLVRQARIYHHPDKPEAPLGQAFDVVTFDENGKVLHLLARVPQITSSSFRALLQRALEVKQARIENGDVGALVLVSPSFPGEVVEEYLKAIESTSRGLSRLQESFTGYAGFFRVGRRRGFHILLVEEVGGRLQPMFR